MVRAWLSGHVKQLSRTHAAVLMGCTEQGVFQLFVPQKSGFTGAAAVAPVQAEARVVDSLARHTIVASEQCLHGRKESVEMWRAEMSSGW